MGTDVTITVYCRDKTIGEKALKQAFQVVRKLSYDLSDYEPESELSQLSAAPVGKAMPISAELWEVLKEGQAISIQSEGAFDVTVGPISRLWRRARRLKRLPLPERVEAARAKSGFQHLKLDASDPKVTLAKSDMRLDLGGIAKGFVADRALAVLKKHGVTRASVNAGGDLVLGEAPPDRPGWKVGLAPLEPQKPPTRFYFLKHCGVATSGDAWQYIELDGKRFSHIIDPRRGQPVQGRSSVTVVAPSGLAADAWASAISVLGTKAGFQRMKLASTKPIHALVVRVENERATAVLSPGFQKLPMVPGPPTKSPKN